MLTMLLRPPDLTLGSPKRPCTTNYVRSTVTHGFAPLPLQTRTLLDLYSATMLSKTTALQMVTLLDLIRRLCSVHTVDGGAFNIIATADWNLAQLMVGNNASNITVRRICADVYTTREWTARLSRSLHLPTLSFMFMFAQDLRVRPLEINPFVMRTSTRWLRNPPHCRVTRNAYYLL
jgi:hypothetical protein